MGVGLEFEETAGDAEPKAVCDGHSGFDGDTQMGSREWTEWRSEVG